MSKIRILLADDHSIMRDGIRALLNVENEIEIIGEASDGKEAIDKAQKLVPDLIIMDIAMPGIDGIEATRLITEKNPKIKIIVLTQYDQKDYVLSAIKAGAAGYVTKRSLGSDLITAIHTVYEGESFLHPLAAANLIEDYRQTYEKKESSELLTEKERSILKLIAEGYTSKQIAAKLSIHLRTVTGYRIKIMKRLNLHDRVELVSYAKEKRLLNVDQTKF